MHAPGWSGRSGPSPPVADAQAPPAVPAASAEAFDDQPLSHCHISGEAHNQARRINMLDTRGIDVTVHCAWRAPNPRLCGRALIVAAAAEMMHNTGDTPFLTAANYPALRNDF